MASLTFLENTMNRSDLLNQARELTETTRNADYGEPAENLGNIAVLWEAYMHCRGNYRPLTSEDVAWLNVLQKIARTFNIVAKPDTYIDAAAYSAIAGECAAGDKPA